jgi:hypothetical protein
MVIKTAREVLGDMGDQLSKLKPDLQDFKERRRETIRAQAKLEQEVETSILQEWVTPIPEYHANGELGPGSLIPPEPEEREPAAMLPPASKVNSPISSANSLPALPDPISQPFKARRDDRVAAGRSDNKGDSTAQVPPVPLTDEQHSWMFILERYEAMTHCRKERRALLWNQWATLALSLIGVIGGGLAIRNGIRSASEK